MKKKKKNRFGILIQMYKPIKEFLYTKRAGRKLSIGNWTSYQWAATEHAQLKHR